MVAEEFKNHLAAKGVTVEVHHIREIRPRDLPPADRYLFSSPGRMGRPIAGMRRFLHKLALPPGTRYAVLTTEVAPRPDKRTGRLPTDEGRAETQRVIPIINEILKGRVLVEVEEGRVLVTGLRGPLEEGWRQKVDAFADRMPVDA